MTALSNFSLNKIKGLLVPDTLAKYTVMYNSAQLAHIKIYEAAYRYFRAIHSKDEEELKRYPAAIIARMLAKLDSALFKGLPYESEYTITFPIRLGGAVDRIKVLNAPDGTLEFTTSVSCLINLRELPEYNIRDLLKKPVYQPISEEKLGNILKRLQCLQQANDSLKSETAVVSTLLNR